MLSSHLFDKRVQACVKTSKLIQIIQSQLGEVIRRPLIACWWFFVCKRDERLKSKYNHSVITQSSLSHICEGCFKSLCRRTHRLRCVPFSTCCHQKQKCLKEGCCQGTTSELVTGLKKKKKTAWELKLFAPDDKQQPTFLKGKKGHKHNALKRTWKVA